MKNNTEAKIYKEEIKRIEQRMLSNVVSARCFNEGGVLFAWAANKCIYKTGNAQWKQLDV